MRSVFPPSLTSSSGGGGAVSSVFGRTGAVVAQSGDYSAIQIPNLVQLVTQSATPTINTDTGNIFAITSLAQAITSMTTNLSGTPVHGQVIWIEITDNGTARAITWGAKFASTSNATLPTTTVSGVILRCVFTWNVVTSTWDCIQILGGQVVGSGGFAPQSQVWTTVGTTVLSSAPVGATKLSLTVIGAGGGGGSGSVQASGTNSFGGGGGGGAGMTHIQMLVSDLSFPLNVIIGAGGTSGAAQSTNTSTGNNGGGGGYSAFGNFVRAPGGNPGNGGSATAGAAGAGGGNANFPGGAGGAGASGAGSSSNSGTGAAGGAGGGGVNTTPTASAGGTGATCFFAVGEETGGASGTVGSAGGAGTASTVPGTPGAGGGGGGAALTGAGGAGGSPAGYGGGGGGGGAALNSQGGSGAGGAGAQGYIRAVWS